jgi:hypothetical protein
VLSLIPDDRRSVLDGIRVEIEDQGANYRVTVFKGSERTERIYSDQRRDCEQRARFAAVFTALTLMPPQIAEREQRPPPRPTPKPAPAPHPPPPSAPPALVRIQLGIMLDTSLPLQNDVHATLPGAELGVVLGEGQWAAGLAVAYSARRTFDLHGIHGSLERMPGFVFGRWRQHTGALELALDAGVGATIARVETTGLLQNRVQTRPEADAHAGAQLAWLLGAGVSPFVAARVTWVPAPYSIAVAPRANVGSLPHLWLGGMLGVSLAL